MMTLTELFSDPSRWCQGYLTKGKSRRNVNPFGKYAVSWCLRGGLFKCYPDLPIKHHSDLEDRINEYLRVDSLVNWNDSPERTIQDIQEIATVIDAWIEDMKAKGEIE